MKQTSRYKLFLVLGFVAILTAAFVVVEICNRISIADAKKTSSSIFNDIHYLVPEDSKHVERVEFNVTKLTSMVKRSDQAQVRVAIGTTAVLSALASIFIALAYQEKLAAGSASHKTEQ